jgi:hypothetical protein
MRNKVYCIIILVVFCHAYSFCQNVNDKKKLLIGKDFICRESFLKNHISHTKYYSYNIFVPVIIAGDKYRIMIKSEYLHRYLTIMNAKNKSDILNDSTFLDSTVYLNKVLRIIYKKEQLVFIPSVLKIFSKEEKKEIAYTILDKVNPYTKEIKRYGLDKFIQKRLTKIGERGNNTLYKIDYEKSYGYGRLNEYNLNYLIEALFEYNFVYELGDGMNGFTKIGCK